MQLTKRPSTIAFFLGSRRVPNTDFSPSKVAIAPIRIDLPAPVSQSVYLIFHLVQVRCDQQGHSSTALSSVASPILKP